MKKQKKQKKHIPDLSSIIMYPLSTEKSIRLMEAENKLLFVVHVKASKPQIREAMEKLFGAKVVKVNTLIDTEGKKRAYIQFAPETPAIDIANNLGLM